MTSSPLRKKHLATHKVKRIQEHEFWTQKETKNAAFFTIKDIVLLYCWTTCFFVFFYALISSKEKTHGFHVQLSQHHTNLFLFFGTFHIPMYQSNFFFLFFCTYPEHSSNHMGKRYSFSHFHLGVLFWHHFTEEPYRFDIKNKLLFTCFLNVSHVIISNLKRNNFHLKKKKFKCEIHVFSQRICFFIHIEQNSRRNICIL